MLDMITGRGGFKMPHQLKDIMATDIAYVTLEDNVFEAASLMRDHDIGMVPVVDQGMLRGVITDRDLVVRGIAEKRPNSSTVSEVMSSRLIYGTPDMSVDEAAKLMADAQVRRLPVVENERLVGVISLGDIAVHTPSQNEASAALHEISETHHPHASNDISG
jgi:CBS domain-containing protein